MSYYSCWQGNDRDTEKHINDIKISYNITNINYYIRYAERDIKDMQAAIKRTQQYLSEAYYHKQHVSDTNFKYQVCFSRSAYSNKVHYYTGVYMIPCVPNGHEMKVYIDSKRWEGKDRHLAKKAAAELAKKYKCDIVNK